jgi:hypothetical protein
VALHYVFLAHHYFKGTGRGLFGAGSPSRESRPNLDIARQKTRIWLAPQGSLGLD